jgi:dephospho-CoA kinase
MVFPALIGLTGSIACGKSTCTAVLNDLDEAVLDFDELSRQVMRPGQAGWSNVVKEFGDGVLQPSAGSPGRKDLREVDRDRLGRMIFGDDAARRRLNRCMAMPIRMAAIREILYLWFVCGKERIFLDAPLLFESGLDRLCAATVCVFVDEPTQLARLRARDDIDEEYARQKITSQMALSEKVARATHTVDNNGTVAETAARVRWLVPRLPPSTVRRISFHVVRVGIPVLVLAKLLSYW